MLDDNEVGTIAQKVMVKLDEALKNIEEVEKRKKEESDEKKEYRISD